MEIKINKTEVRDVGFNYIVFMNELELIDRDLDKIQLEYLAGIVSNYIKFYGLFNMKSDDTNQKIQLLTTEYVGIYDVDKEILVKKSESKKQLIKFSLPVISVGVIRNYPKNTDLVVDKLYNTRYNFRNLENIKKTLSQAKHLFHILATFDYMNTLTIHPMLTAKSTKTINFVGENTQVPFSIKSENAQQIKNYFDKRYINIDFNNVDIFIQTLKDAGLLSILHHINGDSAKINKILKQKEYEIQAELYYDAIKRKYYKNKNSFNRLYIMLKAESSSYKSILSKIEKYSVNNIEELKLVITDKEFNTIVKLIEVKVQPTNECAHNNEFIRFYRLIEMNYRGVREDLDEELTKLKDYISIKNHIASCTKCGQFLFCQHNIDFLAADYKTKMELVTKYSGEVVDMKVSFCKYCGQKIYKDETEEIMTADRFNAILHARAMHLQKTTEFPVIMSNIYSTVRRVIGMFKYKYDINVNVIAKDIQNIITTYVTNRVHRLKVTVEDENFDIIVQKYAFIYAVIYMMDIFVKDGKVTLDAVRKKDKVQYANYFGKLIYEKYRKVIVDNRELTTDMSTAYIDLNPEIRTELIYNTGKQNVIEILQDQIYDFIYLMFNLEKMLSANVRFSAIDAYKFIVKLPNPTLETYLQDVYDPTKSASVQKSKAEIYKKSYEYIIDFNSPKNYLNRFYILKNIVDIIEFPNHKRHEFDGSLAAELQKYNDWSRQYVLKCKYLNLFKGIANMPSIFISNIVGEFISENGNFAIWKPEFGKTKRDIKDYYYEENGKKVKLSESAKLDIKKILDIRQKDIKAPKFKTQKTVNLNVKIKDQEYKYTFNKGIFNSIVKVFNNIDMNIFKYMGRSSDVFYFEFVKGNISPELDLYIGVYRLNYYIMFLINNYNSLRFRHTDRSNLIYFETDKLKSKIGQYKLEDFPDIESGNFIKTFNSISQNWNKEDIYNYEQEYFINTMLKLSAKKDDLIDNFLDLTINKIINIDRLYTKYDPKSVSVDSQNYENDQEVEQLFHDKEDIDEDAEDYVDPDEVDFEQDENIDNMPEPSD